MLRQFTKLKICHKWFQTLGRENICTNATKILSMRQNKDLPNPFLPTPVSKLFSPDTDILMEQLKNAKSVDRNLELTSMHLDVMNVNHIVCCLHNIYQITKSENALSDNLLENIAFQGLCSKLMKMIRLLEPQELVTTLKCLTGLRIRNNTYIMQCVLKMVGSSLNDMSIGQLIFLNFILNKQKSNSLVEGLKLALPLVLQVQLEQQLDSENITQVVDCLHMASRARLKPATIQKVLSTILAKAKMLSTQNAITAIFAMLYLEAPMDGYKELLNHCYEVLSSDIESLNTKQIHSLLRLCESRGSYNSRFLFAVANKIVSENWSLPDTYYAICDLLKLSFAPDDLKCHFAKVLCSESEILKNNENFSLLVSAMYLNCTGYQPENIEEALRAISSCEQKLYSIRQKAPNLFIKLMSCITALGHFPDCLTDLLDEDFLYEAWAISRKQGKTRDFDANILSLIWSFELYDQQNNFKFPTVFMKKFIQSVCEKHSDSDSALTKFLENGLGGSQFMQNKIFTHDGILIDHVLGMRSGNYPVALHTSQASAKDSYNRLLFVEDIILPLDAKLVAVIVANQGSYCNDPEVLKGWKHLMIKSLMKKNYYPVVINYSSWENLPDREKIPYLMQEIKNSIQVEDATKFNIIG